MSGDGSGDSFILILILNPACHDLFVWLPYASFSTSIGRNVWNHLRPAALSLYTRMDRRMVLMVGLLLLGTPAVITAGQLRTVEDGPGDGS